MTDSSNIPGDSRPTDDEKLVLTSAQRVGEQDGGDTLVLGRGAAVAEQAAPAREIDDAALRAMVSEIVREELRGPLGERMTRNLRKLVRREIARALAMRDAG